MRVRTLVLLGAVLIFPLQLLGHGELFFSLWNRSYFSGSELSTPDIYETNYQFGFTRMIPNYGELRLRLDGIQTPQAFKLGRGRIGFDGLRLGGFLVESEFGDTHFTFTNFEDHFSNIYDPQVYIRGGKLRISGSKMRAVVFGGRAADLKGLFGTTYDVGDQNIAGFHARFQPSSFFSLGTGYLHSENERDSLGEPVTRRNRIVLVDGELRFSESIRFLGEYRYSRYRPAAHPGENDGGALRFGPILKSGRLTLEANYRRIDSDFRFVNPSVQLERDREGFFLLTDYRLSRNISLIGHADRSRNNVARDPLEETLHSTRGLVGLSFHSPSGPSLSLRFSIAERETPPDALRPVDSVVTSAFINMHQSFGRLNLYLRYFRQDVDNRIPPAEKSSRDTFHAGIRHAFKRNSMIWLEGEWNADKDFSGEASGRDLRGRIGLNLSHSANFNFYSVATYSLWQSRFAAAREKLDIYLALSLGLPLGFNLSVNLGADRFMTSPLKELRGSNYRLTLKIDKRMRWGQPLPGVKPVPGERVVEMGHIEGSVFEDVNFNGIRDPGEKGYPGIRVTLQDGTATTTDARGRFRFSRLPLGAKRVRIDLRDIPMDLNLLDDAEKSVIVERRSTAEVNFRLITSAAVSGRVVHDTGKTGRIDSGAKGIPDVLIWLIPAEEAPGREPLNIYTDAEGYFRFGFIVPGAYHVFPDKTGFPERAVFTTPETLKIQIGPGERLESLQFLVHIPPRRIRIDSKEGGQ